MWTNRKMDDLMTLKELTTETEWTMARLCAGTQIDSATQAEIFNWYQYRKVCDNDKFPAFFNRQLSLYENQYLAQIRLEMVEWDPLVADYMERQILRATTGSSEATGSASGSKSHSGRGGKTITQDTTTRVDTTGSNTGVMDDVTSSSTEGQTVGHATDNKQEETSGTKTSITDGTTSSNTTGQAQSQSSDHAQATGDNQALAGSTPDSALYPASGFPEGLAWRYASAQNESKSATDTQSTHTDNSQNSSQTAGTDHRSTTDTTENETDTYNVHNETTSTSSDTDGTEHKTLSETNQSQTTGRGTGQTIEQDNSSSAETNRSSSFENKSNAENEDTRERYTGRHASPQELLNAARNYIRKTNAFEWLLNHLDNVFLMVYDV